MYHALVAKRLFTRPQHCAEFVGSISCVYLCPRELHVSTTDYLQQGAVARQCQRGGAGPVSAAPYPAAESAAPPASSASASMNQLGTVYATKRRRRNGKSLKPTPKDGVTKSNPSKRHRERLNAELDTLASLLPFEQNILSKLDRLSILRLSVSYLRTKSYFQVVMHKDKDDPHHRSRDLTAFDHTLLDGEMFLQALNGFLMILTCEGEVFFATHSIEGYLGFHQSDIVHQSVYELVHSEDREELQRQLMWNSFLPPESGNLGLQDVLQGENCQLLERSFTVRFRCLLDNTSGFLRLDIRGRVKVLHGQNRKSEEPPLALFAICTPFGPPSLLEIPQKEVMFKSKHKLDLALVSMDQRGKMLLGYSDAELANMGGYDLVHYDDLAYVASAHQELLKTGASGMIAYRFQTKEGQWQWLQTSSRLVYKNSKPDFVISTHRPLMEEEGRDLLGKRTMDFKVSYLDAGLPNSYFTESETLLSTTPPSTSHPLPTAPARVNRRYKTQLRDFLSTCRTKRKLASGAAGPGAAAPAAVAGTAAGVGVVAAPGVNMAPVEYLGDGCGTAYNMYPAGYTTGTEHGLGYMGHTANFQHGLYDQRYLTTTENLFHQYRPLGTYYPEYHTTSTVAAPYNGFASCTMPTYDPTTTTYPLSTRVDEKLYSCQQVVDPATTTKYPTYVDSSRGYVVANATKCLDVSWPYSVSPSSGIIQPVQVMAQHVDMNHKKLNNKHPSSLDGMSSTHSEVSSPVNGILTPKMEEIQTGSPSSHHLAMSQQNSVPPHHFSPVTTASQEVTRQTVLMWGSGLQNQTQHHISASSSSTSRSPPSNASTPSVHQITGHYSTTPCDPLKSLQEMNSQNVGVQGVNQDLCKWNEAVKNEAVVSSATVPGSQPGSPSLGGQHQQHHTHQSSRVVMVL